MKRILYIVMILSFVSIVFLGCTNQPTVQESTSTVAAQATPAPTSQDSPSEPDQITIISPVFYSGTIDTTLGDKSTEYLEALFKDNGFNVVFDRVYYNLDSKTCYEEYYSYLSQSLAKDNTISFVPGYKSDLLSNYIKIAKLAGQIEQYAPDYYKYTERNPIVSISNNNMITTKISDFDDVTVALFFNSIRSEYSKDIEKSQDYLGFIGWARNAKEDMRASVILTFHDDITSRSNILYDMFLPQQGYIPLGPYLGETYSLCVEAKKPNNIYDTTKLSFYDSMLENIEVMANYQKIVVKHENNAKKNFSEYSSVVMPLGDVSYYADIHDYNFYPPNYTMEILNPNMFLERVHENVYLAAADGTNQEKALELINWIYKDINNYIVVKYGEAGVNYSFNENNYIYLTDAGKEYVSNSPMSNLISNIEFEASLNSLPYNYLNEINTIEYLKNDNFYKQYENYQNLITTNNYIYDSVNRFTRRWETSVRALELTTERKVNFEPGTFVFDNIDDLITELSK